MSSDQIANLKAEERKIKELLAADITDTKRKYCEDELAKTQIKIKKLTRSR